jgi:hypothetical protein
MASPFTVRFALATAFPLLACACGAASSPNPAGTSGSTGPAEVPVPAAVQAVYAKLASLYTTGTADLDGDGRAEYTRTVLPDGSVRDVIDSKGDGVPSLVAVRDRAGNESITLGRGGPWLTRENRVGPPRVVVTTSDTQLDGILDRRVTVTYDVPASSRLVRTETWNATSGTFVLAQETVLPIAVPSSPAAAASCDDGFGASWPGNDPRCLGFSSNLCVNVMEGGGGGYCDDAQFKAIQEALLCAAGTLDCIAQANDAQGRALTRALYEVRVEFACGNRCPQLGWEVDWGNGARISLNPAYLGDAKEACHVVTHELLHAGGAPYDAAEHSQGWDQLHACTRRCAPTTNLPPGSTPHRDCVACAQGDRAQNACRLLYY